MSETLGRAEQELEAELRRRLCLISAGAHDIRLGDVLWDLLQIEDRKRHLARRTPTKGG